MPFLKVSTYIITGFTACPIRFAAIHVIMAVIHVIMAVLTIKTTVILYFLRLFFPCDFINIGSQKVILLEMKMRQKYHFALKNGVINLFISGCFYTPTRRVVGILEYPCQFVRP
jgi:hypothetical protein